MTAEELESMKESFKSDIKEMLRQIQINTATTNTLWNQKDIAEYLRTSTKNLQNTNVFKRPDFPRAIIIPTTEIQPAKRWKANEIMTWAQKIREVPAHKKQRTGS